MANSMYKAPEELFFEYDPVYFLHTRAMDVYTFDYVRKTLIFELMISFIYHPLLPISFHIQVSFPYPTLRLGSHSDI